MPDVGQPAGKPLTRRQQLALPMVIEVPDLGTFKFRHRTIKDQLWIEREAMEMLGGETESAHLRSCAIALATVERLTIEAPDGWDIQTVDPLDGGAVSEVYRVFGELVSTESRFRGRPLPAGKAVGTGAVADPGVLVPAEIQPGAE
jgi:hypothetical protein